MQPLKKKWVTGIMAFAAMVCSASGPVAAIEGQAADAELEEPWVEPLPIPMDPVLEQQLYDVQEAVTTIHKEMVKRKDLLSKTTDAAAKAKLYDEFEQLREEREDLEALLHELVNDARASERTEIDEALAKARWLERQQDYHAQREEIIRDRQE